MVLFRGPVQLDNWIWCNLYEGDCVVNKESLTLGINRERMSYEIISKEIPWPGFISKPKGGFGLLLIMI